MTADGILADGVRRDAVEEEKRAWLRTIRGKDFDATLLPFEMLLRAMDRFFRLDNHPRFFLAAPHPDANLKTEVGIANHQLRQLIQLSQSILDETDTSAFMFQSYVETHLVSDRDRDALLDRHRGQSTPLESLYLLRIGLQSLVNLTGGLSDSRRVGPGVFRALGHQYASMLLFNRYFNPFREHGFNPLYERVDHPLLSRAVRSAPTPALRRALSLVVLLLGRYLRVTGWIDPHASSRPGLQSCLPYLAYTSSEFRSLIQYLETSMARSMFPDGPSCTTEREFIAFAESLSFQLRQESRKVFAQLLHGFPNHPELSRLRASLENTRGLLTSFLQQTVVSLVQIVMPEVEGRDLYKDFTSRLEQSIRLRDDMWVFHELLAFVSSILSDSGRSAVQRDRAVFALVQYLDTFEKGSLPNVRLSDLEEFERFFDRVRALDAEPLAGPSHLDELARNIEVFRIYVQTSLELIGNRSELQSVELDTERPRHTLKHFLDLAGAGPDARGS